ncbi:MAG: HAD family hydrolase [Desulfobacteraceae bacterium]|nr:MAG: HAD family hydrolase [Desulfobacteraceae bacterium]
MFKAVLIDLDNTMILFDETAFYQRYMERIVPYFDDLVPAEQFRERLLRGIRGLLQNNGAVSNREFFLDIFCAGYDDRRRSIWERFLGFYHSEYEKIPVEVKIPAGLEALLDQLAAWGLTVVVATNPLFPEIAQRKRLAWAEIDPQRFDLLTHLDNSCFVKPRREYYRQICAMIGLPPQACLMVGNDRVNDMVAGTLGIKTFLTTEAGAIDYGAVTKGRDIRAGQSYAADHSGPLADVVDFLARAVGR